MADGKVYVGNYHGKFLVLQAGRELKVLYEAEFGKYIHNSAVAANGVLYVPTSTSLYAFGKL